MKTLNYQEQFAEQVKNGSKRQTIRNLRKNPFVIGDKLRHYTGQRTKKCRRLLDSVCTNARGILIAESRAIHIDGKSLTATQSHTLAVADGFRGVNHMINWFEDVHGLPFVGQVVNW